ncbi:hypothetical protein TSUD_168290 [Trifolium subterraneum]|nr:hypothetical protein TSUD_168290 [Trifolium subterraneum]
MEVWLHWRMDPVILDYLMLLNNLDSTFDRHISSRNLNALAHDLVHFLDFVGTKTWLGNAPMQVGQPLDSVKSA